MMKKVVISGPWHGSDRKYIKDSEDLQIINFPHLDLITDFPFFLENAREADLVVLALFGTNLSACFKITELLPFLHDNKIRKVCWTQDAQHEWGMGLEYQRWFQKFYLNYSGYMDKYEEVEPCWLPSCFFSIGIDELTELISFPKEIERDIIFPYADYSLDDRSLVAKKIREKLTAYGLNYYLGKIEFGLPYLRSIQESKICLNISTLGSLNIRNFEVLALNRILLTERVADHDRIKMDMSHTYFFKRDLSDLDDALKKALNDTATDIRTSDDILNNHMLVHRYIEIINNELNTLYKVQKIDIQAVGDTMQLVRNIRELLGTEKYEEAGRIIDHAVEQYPNSPDLRNLMGEFLVTTGKIEEATKIFLFIQERWPYHVETLNNIAIILCFKRDWYKAKKLLQGALRISPSNKSVLENLKYVQNEILISEANRFLQHDNYFEANKRIEKVLDSDNQHIGALNLRALIHVKRGNLEEAKKSLSMVLQIEPDNEEAIQSLKHLNQQKTKFNKMNTNIEELYAGITISRKEFLNDLKNAVENNIAYATGKIGLTAQYMLKYEIILNESPNDIRFIKDYEKGLEFNCLKQQGIFPNDYDFIRFYAQFYAQQIKSIDCLGLCYGLSQYPDEFKIIDFYKLKNKFIHFVNQEPDRSVPSNDENCYLHYFRDKKILLICPFAEILKERATKEIFEGVWSKTGKKWFHPKKVDALEFPYGFSSETHKKYSTVIDLFDYIKAEINKKDFDIALIAAAGLAIPIASYVKDIGKIAIDLGGHLQIIFGVFGKRWKDWEDWKRDYFNDYWIDMPAKYRPKEKDVCDHGAYW